MVYQCPVLDGCEAFLEHSQYAWQIFREYRLDVQLQSRKDQAADDAVIPDRQWDICPFPQLEPFDPPWIHGPDEGELTAEDAGPRSRSSAPSRRR